MGRKASYTDRPLTEEERIFAEKHHDLMYRYMRIHELDINEWYDRLIIPYLQAVKKYHEYKKLQNYKFEQIFFRTLDSARSCYWRDLNRKKRCPEGGVWSFDDIGLSEFPITEGKKDRSKSEYIRDLSKVLIEDEISDKLNVQHLIDELEQYRLKEVVYMLIAGYCGAEIQRKLKLNRRVYKNMIEEIRNILSQFI